MVIVGAGIAGLTAAWRLRQAGVPFRLHEASATIGGRMRSLRGVFAAGQVAELGGEFIDSGHASILALAGELGIALDDLGEDDPQLLKNVWHFGGERRTDAQVVDAFRPIAERIEAALATLSSTEIGYRNPSGAEKLDRMSIPEWLDGIGATGWIRTLLVTAFTSEFGLEADRQSALNLLTLIDPNPDPFRIYGDSDERFHVRGGNDRIIHALGGRVREAITLSSALESVRHGSDGRYVLSFREAGRSSEVRAERVLLTVPFSILRHVELALPLPEVKRRAIDTLAYGTNTKLMVGFSDRVWRVGHRCNGSVMSDRTFQATWETSRLQAGAPGILTNFTGGAHGLSLVPSDTEAHVRRFVENLDSVLPGHAATRAGMKHAIAHWSSMPWAGGSYASYAPGQWTGIGGAEGEAVGGVHFAGEHTSRVAQGFMEGGCESGERAAVELLEALGRRAPVAQRRLTRSRSGT